MGNKQSAWGCCLSIFSLSIDLLYYHMLQCFLDQPYQKYSQTKTVSLYNSLQLAFCVMSVLNCVFFFEMGKRDHRFERNSWPSSNKIRLIKAATICFDSDMFSCSLESNTPGIFCRLFCFPRTKPMTIGLALLVWFYSVRPLSKYALSTAFFFVLKTGTEGSSWRCLKWKKV